MNNINEYSYNIALNMYRKLTGDYDTSFENTDDIYTAIDENFDSGDGRYNTEEINLSIDENGEFHYVKTDTVDAYVPVNISVDIKQKYTDEQVTELQSTARQEGYNDGYGVGFNEGSDEGYQDGYAEGLDDGAQDQRDLLEEITITENGIYEKEDGYNKVTVSVAGSGGGSGFDFSEIGYDAAVSMSINSDIQADIDYSKQLYESWNPSITAVSGTFQALPIVYAPNIDTSNVTNMGSMFYGCRLLRCIGNFNTSNVTNMGSMFQKCSSLTSLDLSGWDTSNVTNMSYMFEDCSSLTSLDLSDWDTSKVTNMSYMFEDCSSLTSLDLSDWDTSKVTNMYDFLYASNKIKYLDIRNFDFSNVTNINYFLPTSGSKLIDLRFGKNLKINWTGSGSPNSQPNLTKESLLSIIDGLYDFVGNGETTTKKCQFGSTNLAKLTDEEKALATNKGWTLT